MKCYFVSFQQSVLVWKRFEKRTLFRRISEIFYTIQLNNKTWSYVLRSQFIKFHKIYWRFVFVLDFYGQLNFQFMFHFWYKLWFDIIDNRLFCSSNLKETDVRKDFWLQKYSKWYYHILVVSELIILLILFSAFSIWSQSFRINKLISNTFYSVRPSFIVL